MLYKSSQHGLLLINIGTPTAITKNKIKKFLRKFLTDKHIINLPSILRYILVYCFIIPLRINRIIKAYQAIQHQPTLLSHSNNLCQKLQKNLGNNYKVTIGMNYSEPSLQQALNQLKNCHTITVLPLYPQYSSAATESAIENILKLITKLSIYPTIHIIREFYNHDGFIIPQSKLLKQYLTANPNNFILFSFHGIPENQLHKICPNICTSNCAEIHQTSCYRSQCFATAKLIAQQLQLNNNNYTVAFQSRLGKIKWLTPYLENKLIELAKSNIKNLTIICPSFVADCLETLEEINLRARQLWQTLGGENFILVPCLNDHHDWVLGIRKICNIH